MADAKSKWQDATRQILQALDLVAEYSALGLQLSRSQKPNSKGWVYCHSVDVDQDRSPSAGINVSDGPYLGRYKDFRSGRTCTFFDFAAQTGKFAGDWKEARNHFARQTGVKLPDGEEELVADRFEFFDLTFGIMALYAAEKPGVTARAIQEIGCRGARWPKKLAPEKTNHLLAAPMHGSALLELEPTGWHCVAANPKAKIRKFQGHGNQDDLIKTMTAGDYGLMNVDALNRIVDADTIWIVEGFSDLLACQAVLGPWRDEIPESRKHIVVSAGGCSYHPKAEWVHHFAGKQIRICFDVGDANNEGQIGAAVWVAALLPVAKEVRNVQLPLGHANSKNDLRAWLVAGHSYDDLVALAETFPPIEATNEAAQLSPHDALLKNLQLTVIGEHEGSQRIEVFSEAMKKSHTIMDIDKLSVAKLTQLVGNDPVDLYVHDGKEPQPGKFQMKDVRNAIASAASDKMFHGEEFYGAGVWSAGGQLVLVRSGEVGFVDPVSGKIERSHVPYRNGCILDVGRTSGEWVDLGQMSRYMIQAADQDWCVKTFEEVSALASKWYWRYPSAPRLFSSLVITSWLQTLWEWRPQIFLTGASDTGKSKLIELLTSLFGKLAMPVQKTTEAAIRQKMRNHAKIMMLDEFEHDAHRQKILDLLRTSSRGGESIRGTADQRGTSYRLRHIAWLSAIETGLRRQADLNRFIILDLNEIPKPVRGKISLPSQEKLQDLGIRMLAVGLKHFHAAERLALHLKGQQVHGVPGRVVESFSVPCGMISAILGQGPDVATEFMRRLLAERDFGEQSARDDVDVLEEILTSEVRTVGGQLSTVTQLLKEYGADASHALERVGVRKVFKRGDNHGSSHLWFNCGMIRRNLLRNNGDFSNQVVGQYLLRLPGATKTRQRVGGGERLYGIEIPMATLDDIFDRDGSDRADAVDEQSSTEEAF